MAPACSERDKQCLFECFSHCYTLIASSTHNRRRGHAQSGATLMWRHLSAKWRHLERKVAPPLSASGATLTYKWRHFNIQVAPLQDASGATSRCKWRHFNIQVAPLHHRHFSATLPPPLRHFILQVAAPLQLL